MAAIGANPASMGPTKRHIWLSFRIRDRVDDLLLEGRSREAVAYLSRVLAHPRLARVFFQTASASALPLVVAFGRGRVTKHEIRQLLERLEPLMSDVGREACHHARAYLSRPLWWRMTCRDQRRRQALWNEAEAAAEEMFRMFGAAGNDATQGGGAQACEEEKPPRAGSQ
jgi:hypothetical protein